MFEEVFDIFKGFNKTLLEQKFDYNRANAITNFDFNTFNDLEIDYDRYYEINNRLHTYLVNNLTTEHIAKYVVDKTGI